MDLFDLFEHGLQDPRWIYLGTFIILFSLATVSIPVTPRPTQMTIDFYNVVVAAQPGQTCICECLFPSPIWGQVNEMTRTSTYQYWYNKGVNLIFVPSLQTRAYDMMWVKQVLGIPADEALNQAPGYGTRFVFMDPNWLTTGTYYITAANLRASSAYDLWGTSFNSLPMMANLKTGKDIYAYVGSALGGDWCIAFGTAATGTKCIATGCAGALTVAATFYGTGLFKGVLIGAKGGQEMDYLLGKPLGTTFADAAGISDSAIAVWTFVCIVGFNIVNAWSYRVRKRPLTIHKEV